MVRSSNSRNGRAHPALKISPAAIGFDFDGVVADIGEAFVRLACDDHGYCTLKLEEICSFQVEHCTNVPGQIVERIFDDILKDSLGTGLKPLPGAVETLSLLSRSAEVTIITARPDIGPVVDWFAHYLEPAARRRIKLIATGDHDNKESFIRECGLRYFVDDRARTCLHLAEAGLSPIVYSQPWNRNQHQLPSVADWSELAALLE